MFFSVLLIILAFNGYTNSVHFCAVIISDLFKAIMPYGMIFQCLSFSEFSCNLQDLVYLFVVCNMTRFHAYPQKVRK